MTMKRKEPKHSHNIDDDDDPVPEHITNSAPSSAAVSAGFSTPGAIAFWRGVNVNAPAVRPHGSPVCAVGCR
jgi:hypothetical protein